MQPQITLTQAFLLRRLRDDPMLIGATENPEGTIGTMMLNARLTLEHTHIIHGTSIATNQALVNHLIAYIGYLTEKAIDKLNE